MTWKEIKGWAIKNGYNVDRIKIDKDNNKYEYKWIKNEKHGIEYSMSAFVQAIYNQMTNNMYISYQENYILNKKEV
jgi:hypothetical protein